jgi:hypothetical protein
MFIRKIHQRVNGTTLTFLIANALFLLVGCPVANAQKCEDVLKFGVFDLSNTQDESKLAEDYLKWLSNREVRDQQEASRTSASGEMTLPADGVPALFKERGENATSARSTWGKELAEYLRANRDAFNKFSQSFVVANKSIVSAWQKCMSDFIQAGGVLCWGEQTANPDEILVRILERPRTIDAPPIWIEEFTYSPHVKPRGRLPIRARLGLAPLPIVFTREGPKKNDGVVFTVLTNKGGDYSCDTQIAGIPNPPERANNNPQPPAEPAVPEITLFKADKVEPRGQSIVFGKSATLNWETKNATQVTLQEERWATHDLGELSVVQGAGSREVSPKETTVYHLAVTGAVGPPKVQDVAVWVVPKVWVFTNINYGGGSFGVNETMELPPEFRGQIDSVQIKTDEWVLFLTIGFVPQSLCVKGPRNIENLYLTFRPGGNWGHTISIVAILGTAPAVRVDRCDTTIQ